jgi:IS5 family transposase
MGVIAERMDYLWFLGYELDDAIPNHSVLSKARARWGGEIFESIFVRTVTACVEAGLVDHKRLLVDSSVVQANASKDSVQRGDPKWIAALRAACQAQESKLDEVPMTGVNATHVSLTDPEATLARKGQQTARLAYKCHRGVDSAHGVITAVTTTTGQSGDAGQLPGLIAQHQAQAQRTPGIVVGDSHYGSAENYRSCQSLGIVTHLKPVVRGGLPPGRFGPEDFHYDAAQDILRCPAGKTLRRHSVNKSENTIEYRIERPEQCAACVLRGQCTTARKGRTVVLPVRQEIVQAAKQQALSSAAQASYRVRRFCMEGSFADAANNHGFKRARWRGLWRQQIQDWLIAAVQNLRLLMKLMTPRPQASAAVVVVFKGSLLLRLVLVLKLLTGWCVPDRSRWVWT